jgi:flagellar protein FlbD
MIRVHRLNGTELVLNAELIDTVESHGVETVIGMVTGNRLLVTESVDRVIELAIEYRRSVYSEAGYVPAFLKKPSEAESRTGSEVRGQGGAPCR